MTVKDPMVKLVTGVLIDMEAFKMMLDQNNIESVLRDQFLEGLHAGIPAGVPNEVSVYVLEHDSQKANELYSQFKSRL